MATAAGQGFVVTYYDEDPTRDFSTDELCGRGQRIAEQVVVNLPPLSGK